MARARSFPRHLLHFCFALAAGLWQAASADAFITYDARDIALGSSGVASSRPHNAAFFNPALLFNNGPTTFAHGSLALRLNDRENFRGGLDDYHVTEDTFSDALDEFNEAVARLDVRLSQYTALLDAAELLIVDIEGLSDRPLMAGVGVNIGVGHAGERYAASIFMRQVVTGGAVIRIAEEDIEALEEMLTALRGIEDAVRTNTVPPDFTVPDPVDEFLSDVAVEAAAITESGVAFGLRASDAWRFGAVIKHVEFLTYDYFSRAGDADVDHFRLRQHERQSNFFNLDLGVALELGQWRFGVVGRDLIEKDVPTIRGRFIKVRPKARAGASWHNDSWLVTADLDLTRNRPIGFDPETRFVSLGSEYRVRHNAALRLGFRHNLVSHENTPSLGFGFGIAEAQADVAVISLRGQQALALQVVSQF